MSKLFELLTKFFEITGNSTIGAVLLWTIVIISFLVAFGVVGFIFDAIGKYDSDIMSGCHWIIRILVFLGLSLLCIWISKFITWLFSFKWWIYLIGLIILIGTVVLIHYLKHKHSKNRAEIAVKNEINEVVGSISQIKKICFK